MCTLINYNYMTNKQSVHPLPTIIRQTNCLYYHYLTITGQTNSVYAYYLQLQHKQYSVYAYYLQLHAATRHTINSRHSTQSHSTHSWVD